jgi:hypothetical protein
LQIERAIEIEEKDEGTCVNVVLDRLEIKDVDIQEMLKEEKEDEYV